MLSVADIAAVPGLHLEVVAGRDAVEREVRWLHVSELEDPTRVLPGHGAATTIGRERSWLELVRDEGRLFA